MKASNIINPSINSENMVKTKYDISKLTGNKVGVLASQIALGTLLHDKPECVVHSPSKPN